MWWCWVSDAYLLLLRPLSIVSLPFRMIDLLLCCNKTFILFFHTFKLIYIQNTWSESYSFD